MARLKDQKRRTLSSRTWLERQLSDPYVARAKRDGFRSRAAYKLAEIDDKYHLLKGGVIALDILEFKPMTGVEFLKLDFLDNTAPDRLKELLGGNADVVLSDMA